MRSDVQFLNKRTPSRFDILALASIGPFLFLGLSVGYWILERFELGGHQILGLAVFGFCFVAGLFPPLIYLIRLLEKLEPAFVAIAKSGFFVLMILNGALIIGSMRWATQTFSSGYSQSAMYALWFFVSSLAFYYGAFRRARRAPYTTARLIAWVHLSLVVLIAALFLILLFRN